MLMKGINFPIDFINFGNIPVMAVYVGDELIWGRADLRVYYVLSGPSTSGTLSVIRGGTTIYSNSGAGVGTTLAGIVMFKGIMEGDIIRCQNPVASNTSYWRMMDEDGVTTNGSGGSGSVHDWVINKDSIIVRNWGSTMSNTPSRLDGNAPNIITI